jgi:Ca2+-binding RTX toxin-like protein
MSAFVAGIRFDKDKTHDRRPNMAQTLWNLYGDLNDFPANIDPAGYQTQPVLVRTGPTSYVAVFNDGGPMAGEITLRFVDVGGNAFIPDPSNGFTQTIAAANGVVGAVDAAQLNDGSIAVIWADWNSGTVVAQKMSVMGPIGAPVTLSTGTTWADKVHIAALNDGGFMATWTDTVAATNSQGVLGVRVDSAGVVGAQTTVADVAGNDWGQDLFPLTSGELAGGYAQFFNTTATYTEPGVLSGLRLFGADGSLQRGVAIKTADSVLQLYDGQGVQLADGRVAMVYETLLAKSELDGQQVADLNLFVYDPSLPSGAPGQVIEKLLLPAATGSVNEKMAPAVTAFEDGTIAVAWLSHESDGSYFIRAALLDGQLNVLNDNILLQVVSPSALPNKISLLALDGGLLAFAHDGYGDGDGTGVRHDVFRISRVVLGDASAESIFEYGPYWDYVYAGAGQDAVYGGPGNDTLLGQGDYDQLVGNAGNDSLDGGDGDDFLDGGVGADTLSGGAGRDIVSYGTAAAGVTIDLDSAAANTGEGSGDVWGGGWANLYGGGNMFDPVGQTYVEDVETLFGSTFDDVLSGQDQVLDTQRFYSLITHQFVTQTVVVQAGDNRIVGGGGSDRIDGRGGNDTLDGGMAADSLYGGAGNDLLLGGNGHDSLDGGAGDDILAGGIGNDAVIGGDGTDTADYAGSLDAVTVNLVTGAGGSSVSTRNGSGVDVLSGIENVVGSAYNDVLVGDGNANRLEGGNGNDNLSGGLKADTLLGGAGDDIVAGGQGMDSLDGGEGNDLLKGALGTDTLTGGAGADHFQFASALDGALNIDTITDFVSGQDVIELSASVFTAYAGLVGARIGTGAQLQYNAATGALSYDGDGFGAGAPITFAVLGTSTHPAGVAADFLIVA